MVLVFLASCEKDPIPQQKYFQTTQVQTGSVLEGMYYVGYTDSFERVEVGAKALGKIVSMRAEVWDSVKPWTMLAKLDALEGKTSYASSEWVIANLEALKISTRQMYERQSEALQEKIKQVETSQDIADLGISGNESGTQDLKNLTSEQLKTIDAQIAEAQTQIDTLNTQKENTLSILKQKEDDVYQNSKTALQNATILANSIVDLTDELLGVTDQNRHKNDDYEMYLGAKSTSQLETHKESLRRYYQKWNDTQKLPTSTHEEILQALNAYYAFFSTDTKDILQKTYWVLENSIESEKLPQSQINQFKSNITDLQSKNQGVILSVSGNYFLGLKGSLDSIASLEKEKKSSIDSLDKGLERVAKQVETLTQSKAQVEAMGQGQLTEIDTKTSIAHKQKDQSSQAVDEIKASLKALQEQKASSLQEIETQISQIKSGQDSSLVMIENGSVTSLISGIVTKKYASLWAVVSPTQPIYELATVDQIKVVVQVPQELLESLTLGDAVKVEIEWVTEVQEAKITKILPSRDMVSKKTSIEISLDNPQRQIVLGSYTKVYFENVEGEVGLIVPNQAILSTFGMPQVLVIDGKKAQLKRIEILKQNDQFSQISWLEIGERVITNGKENIADGEEVSE